jgi:hypothetical protein
MKLLEPIIGAPVAKQAANLFVMEATAASIRARHRWKSRSRATGRLHGVPVKNPGTLLFVTGRIPESDRKIAIFSKDWEGLGLWS